MHEFINMHGGYYFSLLEEMQRGEPSEIRETQFRSCNCPGTTLKHQDFVPLLLGPRVGAKIVARFRDTLFDLVENGELERRGEQLHCPRAAGGTNQ